MTSSDVHPHGPLAGQPVPAALRALRASPPPGFTEHVLTRLGLSGDVDEYLIADGPAGPVFVAFNPYGICHVLAADAVGGNSAAFAARHRQRFGRPTRPGLRPPARLITALRHGRARSLRYDLRSLTEFQQSVLLKALDIPRGEIRPYAWVAREIGRPKAVRAVGTALGQNPVPVLIPCHRVVASGGQLGGYVFGADMKRALLVGEDVRLDEVQRFATARILYIGSDTTSVYCFPTCHNARRITLSHQVLFQSASAAIAADYRPCRKCRPGELRMTPEARGLKHFNPQRI